jgi:YD repeat-containing protein
VRQRALLRHRRSTRPIPYDALQRVAQASNAVGNTSNTYFQWKTTTTDANDHIKDYTKDAFGNLASVAEHTATLLTTTYTYDPLNDLATTTDALGNVRNFTYDGLGRRTAAQDLHAVGHATFGTWNYTYDDAGNVTSQTDPKNQTVNRTYDALNRMLTEDYSGQAGIEVTNTHDSCTNGIGQLCTASSTGAKTSNAYDILGRVTTATTTVSNTSYAMSYAYDRNGDITNTTYPNGSQMSVTYGTAGLPSYIQRKPSGGSWSNIVSTYLYSPQSQVQYILYGNAASSTYFYDASNLYRLSKLQTASNGVSIQNFSYTYDHVDNITSLANTASSTADASTNFTYDELNRLLTASTTNASSTPYPYTYTYDALGNILSFASAVAASTNAGTTSPTILDTLDVGVHNAVNVTSDSMTYNVPAGGTNDVEFVLFASGASTTATQNGTTMHCANAGTPGTRTLDMGYCYLTTATSGTLTPSLSAQSSITYFLFTLQNAVQTNPIDVTNFHRILPTSRQTT